MFRLKMFLSVAKSVYMPGDRIRYSDFDKETVWLRFSASLKNPHCLYSGSGNSNYLTGDTYGKCQREKSATLMLDYRMTKAGWLMGWRIGESNVLVHRSKNKFKNCQSIFISWLDASRNPPVTASRKKNLNNQR